jgi:hypothetical protein
MYSNNDLYCCYYEKVPEVPNSQIFTLIKDGAEDILDNDIFSIFLVGDIHYKPPALDMIGRVSAASFANSLITYRYGSKVCAHPNSAVEPPPLNYQLHNNHKA